MTPPPTRRQFRLRRGLLTALIVAWLAAFAATHTPRREPLPGPRGLDKGLHTLTYGTLGALFGATLIAHGRRRLVAAVWVVVVLAAYGAVDEITQPWAGRTTDLHDWLADVLGAGLAAIACLAAPRISRMPRPSRPRQETRGKPRR